MNWGLVRAIAVTVLAVGLAAASDRGERPPPFPGEPNGPFSVDSGAVILYWCQEVWATRGYTPDDEIKAHGDISTSGLDPRFAPSRHGLRLIEDYWDFSTVTRDALAQSTRGQYQSALANYDSVEMNTQYQVLTNEIATLESKIRNRPSGPAPAAPPAKTPRQVKIEKLEAAIGKLSGYRDRLDKLVNGLKETEGFWNLSNTSNSLGGMGRADILSEMTELRKTIANELAPIATQRLIDDAADPAHFEDYIAALDEQLKFEKKEQASDPVPPQPASPTLEDDKNKLAELKIKLSQLKAKRDNAEGDVADALVTALAAQYDYDRSLLLHKAIQSCIDDQKQYLGKPGDKAPTRTLPGGETVAAASGTVTGFFKHACELPNMSDPADRRLVSGAGSVVIEFKEANEVSIQLRAGSIDNNSAHDTLYTGSGTFDPATGQIKGRIQSISKFVIERWSASVVNNNGRTEVRGQMCSAPDPANVNEYVAGLGGMSLLAYCGGKFWGPEEVAEPSGPERDTSCGF